MGRSLSLAAALAACVVLALPACRTGQSAWSDPSVWAGTGRGRRAKRIPVRRAEASQGDRAAVVDILEEELEHNLAQLQGDAVELPVYFLAYQLFASEELYMESEDGVMVRDDLDSGRSLDVDIRVGDHRLDNSHTREGDYGPGNGLGSGLPVSLDDDALSLAQSIWIDTEQQYKDAVAAYRDVESGEHLRSSDDREHPDFTKETALVHIEREYALDFAAVREQWRPRLVALSAELGGDEAVLRSSVTLAAVAENRYFVNNEGTRIQSGSTRLRVLMDAQAQAEDGMVLQRTATFEAHDLEQLPALEPLLAEARTLREELLALRAAPIADPYTGPAILEGRAAGVFFHEIFGHRLEGHRQKDDSEGQTFTDKLGKSVLPRFLDVIDDPTATLLGDVPLSGHYFVDDEGVASRRTVLVERGKLKTFLLGRSPVLPFRRSNGHGRREPGHQVVARQGNLIVVSRKTLSRSQLRQQLVDEIRRQDKPYGLLFRDIEGGYTITDRSGPQAFKVQPLMVFRVFADGRPDELVRGVELVGTPLSAFETIIATDDQPGIFNGVCGAESGWVPVSAVSPSLLLRNIEIERAFHDRDRPPLLPAPRPVSVRREPAKFREGAR
jgi:TldD protein